MRLCRGKWNSAGGAVVASVCPSPFSPVNIWTASGKELMSQDELAVMDGGKCILQLRGVRPFLSDKYDITRHPNFKYTADADKRNTFDIEAFLSARLKLKPDEVCDVYEVDTEGV